MSTETLTRKRGGHRTAATNLIKKINDEINKTSPSLETLESYAQELDRQKGILVSLDENIQDLLPSPTVFKIAYPNHL